MICLSGLAVVRGGVLFVPSSIVHRVYIPYGHLPSCFRKEGGEEDVKLP